MADDVPEWQMMWGAKVKMPNDMPDDILKDSVQIAHAALQAFPDFDTDGESFCHVKRFHDVLKPAAKRVEDRRTNEA